MAFRRGTGRRKLSAAARAKLSARMKALGLAARLKARRHRPLSAATKAKIRAKLKGRKRPHHGRRRARRR